MSVCPICNQRLQPGLGHSCFKPNADARSPGPIGFDGTLVPDKTWRQLDGIAAELRVRISRRATGGVDLIDIDASEQLLTLAPGNITPEIADKLIRVTVFQALHALRSLR